MATMTLLALFLFTAGAAIIIYWLFAADHMHSTDLSGSGTLLRSDRYPLTGKPDVVLKKGRTFMPVEYKSYDAGGSAREWDVAQLLSYCLLIEECRGRTKGGRLVYRDMEFFIPWDDRSRRYVENIMLEMLEGYDRMTDDRWKCNICEFKDFCGR